MYSKNCNVVYRSVENDMNSDGSNMDIKSVSKSKSRTEVLMIMLLINLKSETKIPVFLEVTGLQLSIPT